MTASIKEKPQKYTKKDIFYLWATFDLLFFIIYIKNHLNFEKLFFGDFVGFINALPFWGDFLTIHNSINHYFNNDFLVANLGLSVFLKILFSLGFLLYPLMIIGIVLLYKQKTSGVVLAYLQAPFRILSGTFSVFFIAYPLDFIHSILEKNLHNISANSFTKYLTFFTIFTVTLAIALEIFKLYTLTKANKLKT